MEAVKTEKTHSEEMDKFYRVLETTQADMILRLRDEEDEEKRNALAAKFTEQLLGTENFGERGNTCGPNEKRNPITGNCEPL